jgi:hypothetical protein
MGKRLVGESAVGKWFDRREVRGRNLFSKLVVIAVGGSIGPGGAAGNCAESHGPGGGGKGEKDAIVANTRHGPERSADLNPIVSWKSC